jgi:hypothetical protein
MTSDQQSQRAALIADILAIITDQRADEPDSDDALIAGAVAEHLVSPLLAKVDLWEATVAANQTLREGAARLLAERDEAIGDREEQQARAADNHREALRAIGALESERVLRRSIQAEWEQQRVLLADALAWDRDATWPQLVEAAAERTREGSRLIGERRVLLAERDEARAALTLAAAEAEDARDGGLGLVHELAEAQAGLADLVAQRDKARDDLADVKRQRSVVTDEWIDASEQRAVIARDRDAYRDERDATQRERDLAMWLHAEAQWQRDEANARSARCWLAWQSARNRATWMRCERDRYQGSAEASSGWLDKLVSALGDWPYLSRYEDIVTFAAGLRDLIDSWRVSAQPAEPTREALETTVSPSPAPNAPQTAPSRGVAAPTRTTARGSSCTTRTTRTRRSSCTTNRRVSRGVWFVGGRGRSSGSSRPKARTRGLLRPGRLAGDNRRRDARGDRVGRVRRCAPWGHRFRLLGRTSDRRRHGLGVAAAGRAGAGACGPGRCPR